MRTRHRMLVTGSSASGAINGSYERIDHVNGSLGSAPYTMSAFDIPTVYTDENMKDGTGTNTINAVVHRKKHVIIDTATRPLTAPKVDGNGGVVQYHGIDPVWIPSNAYWARDIAAWDVNSTNGELPQRWSINAGFTPNEEEVKSDLYEKAANLKADVLLNLVEANQMWPAIRSLATAIPEMAYHWRKLRTQIRTASGAFLAWKFGVSPIIQDTVNVLQGMERLREDFQRHHDGDKNRSSKVIHVPVSFDHSSYNEGTFGPIVWGKRYYQGSLHKGPEIRYVLVTKPVVPYKTEIFKNLDFCLNRFATSPAQLAWELVPFSFVADWFVDISGLARLIDNVLRKPPYEVISFTRSVSYIVSSRMHHEYFNTGSGASLGRTLVGEVVCSHYERSLVSDTNLVFWNPRFGKNQAGISAALISQQLTKLAWGRSARLHEYKYT